MDAKVGNEMTYALGRQFVDAEENNMADAWCVVPMMMSDQVYRLYYGTGEARVYRG